MATSTLTSGNLSDEIVIVSDSDVQVLISDDSVFAGAIFRIEYETITPGIFIPVDNTRTSKAYSRIYTFKAGKIKVALIGNPDTGDGVTNVVIDVKE